MVSVKLLQNFNVINFKNVEKVMKNGAIQFRNRKYALEYMRKRCAASVRGPNPFEREIGINGRFVMGEANGNSRSVSLDICAEISGHSHPDTYAHGCTMAPSNKDYVWGLLTNKKCRQMLVFNSKGQYYSLKKIPGFDFSQVDMDEFQRLARRTFFENTTSEQKELLYMLDSMEVNEIPKFIVDASHKFWVKYGNLFGVKAETNFSNFTNMPIK